MEALGQFTSLLVLPNINLVAMDRTGVIVVPAGKLADVYEAASQITAREERVTKLLMEGRSLAEARRMAKEEECGEEKERGSKENQRD